MLSDDQISNEVKCCSAPFKQLNVNTRIYSCLSCNKKYSIEKTYECPMCHSYPATLQWIYSDGTETDSCDETSDSVICLKCNNEFSPEYLINHTIIKYHT
jgi:hypothetical protein